MGKGNPPTRKPKLILGVRYSERKDNPPPGLVWCKATSIKTKGSPTLGSISDAYGITWQDLVLMNFRTLKGKEINWYLHAHVGCRNHNGTWYQFSGTDDPGYILVPERPPSALKGDPVRIHAVRGGKVKRNTKLWIHVVERRAHGVIEPVRGKWLYVFSGGGRNFGRADPAIRPLKIIIGNREVPRPGNLDDYMPWSAFEPTFQGTFEIAHGPDRLDYEVYITADKLPGQGLFKDLTGRNYDAKKDIRCELGGKWYIISDQKILGKALSEPRFARTHHALRNHQRVPIDLMKNGAPRRYYFFLSPVQLGPEGLKYAMANPKGLTPLLKPGCNGQQWDPDNPSADKFPKLKGPQPGDFKDNQHTLGVIDPYAWAEDIAQYDMADKVSVYQKWLTSTENEVIKSLEKKTGWTPDKYYVARMLRSVRDSHASPKKIDGEIQDVHRWTNSLKDWNDGLVVRSANYTANAHRSMHRLIHWLDSPGHTIIDKAVLEDTAENGFQDAMDFAMSVLHWALVTEALVPMKPGIEFLRQVLGDGARVPSQCFFKHFDTGKKPTNKSLHTGLKISYIGALKLMGLRDFVSTGTQRSRTQLASDIARRRDEIIKNLNAMEILPYKVQPLQLPQSSSQTGGLVNIALLSFLDVGDKLSTYIVEKSIDIPKKFGLNWLRRIEAWSDVKCPRTASAVSTGFSWTLKGTTGVISYLNLQSTMNTARFDYQHDVSIMEWGSSLSSMVISVQDLVSGVAGLKWVGKAALFPEVTTVAGEAGWVVTKVSGTFATGWAVANAFAIFVMGVSTAWLMGQKAWDAYDNGDSTAVAFYVIAGAGGVTIAVGGALLGLGLMKVGGAASLTIYGAPAGLVLFVIGGVVAAIFSIAGWIASTEDDFVIFARKCFLGKDSKDKWRSPKAWSGVKKAPPWPIAKQKFALDNLLARFTLKTKPLGTFESNKIYRDKIHFTIKPGIFPIGSKFAVALDYDDEKNFDVVEFTVPDQKPYLYSYNGAAGRILGSNLQGLQNQATYTFNNRSIVTQIDLKVRVTYDGTNGKPLGTMVTLMPKNISNRIIAKKGIMEEGLLYGVHIDDDTIISDIFT